MEIVRIGIVGAGWVVQNRHLPGLAGVPAARVDAIWSRRPEAAHAVAEQFGIPAVADDWRAIVESPDLDAVIVAAPPALHAPASIAALRAGKHVLCQGRMARNLGEARAMLDAAEASGRVAALYPPRPGLKGDRVVRRLLRDGYVGDVTAVRVTALAYAEPKATYDWTVDPEVVGVNAMALGLWAEVLQRWLGPVTRVAAIGGTQRRPLATAVDAPVERLVPDSLAIAADMANGAVATLQFSNNASFGPGNSLEIFGTRGALAYQFFVEELRGATAGGETLAPIPIAADEERFQTTDAEFISAIRDGTAVSPDFRDGVAYMAFCEAVAQAVATGRTVDVPPDGPAMDAWGRYAGS